MASQRQCRQERPSLQFKRTAECVLQAPSAVYICIGGRRKVDRKGTPAGRISQLLRFAQPPHSSGPFGE